MSTPAHLYDLEEYYLLSALLHLLAFCLAVALHVALGWGLAVIVVAFALTNPLWAHMALWLWRRKYQR